MLVIERENGATLWIRRGYERALEESAFPVIKPMNSYRDAAQTYAQLPAEVHLETEFVRMTEADLVGELYQVMVRVGHQGVARFAMFDTEMIVAQLGFGESSLHPTNFNNRDNPSVKF